MKRSHRRTLAAVYAHPVNANIAWKDIESLFRALGAEISERDANYVVVQQGATSRDVLRLIDLVRSKVKDRFHVELELELDVW